MGDCSCVVLFIMRPCGCSMRVSFYMSGSSLCLVILSGTVITSLGQRQLWLLCFLWFVACMLYVALPLCVIGWLHYVVVAVP